MTLKERFLAQDRICGMHICLSDPAMTELCAEIGFDFLWIEAEHSPMDFQNILLNLIAANSGGTPALVRVPLSDPIWSKRVLEMGPDGIIFPMICSVSEAGEAVKSTLYPPLGNRGYGPQRAVAYGLRDSVEYVSRKSLDIIRIVQVETRQCVEEELDRILENEWIDCVMLGPCDLSASIGRLPDIACPESIRLQDKALRKIRDAGKSAGSSIGAGDPKEIQRWFDRGANVVSCGSEFSFILDGARRTLDSMRAR